MSKADDGVAVNPYALPAKITVGPIDWKVVVDEAERLRRQEKVQSNLHGYTHVAQATILVNENDAPVVQRETLFHELFHALFEFLGLGYEWENEEEERFIRRFSPALLDVLMRNPALIKYLQADLS